MKERLKIPLVKGHREKDNRIERMGPEKPGLLPPSEVLRGKFHG